MYLGEYHNQLNRDRKAGIQSLTYQFFDSLLDALFVSPAHRLTIRDNF